MIRLGKGGAILSVRMPKEGLGGRRRPSIGLNQNEQREAKHEQYEKSLIVIASNYFFWYCMKRFRYLVSQLKA